MPQFLPMLLPTSKGAKGSQNTEGNASALKDSYLLHRWWVLSHFYLIFPILSHFPFSPFAPLQFPLLLHLSRGTFLPPSARVPFQSNSRFTFLLHHFFVNLSWHILTFSTAAIYFDQNFFSQTSGIREATCQS